MPVLGGYQIYVEFNGAVGAFSRITGIRDETTALDSNTHTTNVPFVQKIPGKYTCTPVTFSAGYMLALQSGGPWWTNVEHIQTGDVNSVRGPCVITFLDTNKVPVLIVTLENAWPSKWSASDISIQRNILWAETIVFQCESVKFSWDVGGSG
jgi:phage tail-like protein